MSEPDLPSGDVEVATYLAARHRLEPLLAKGGIVGVNDYDEMVHEFLRAADALFARHEKLLPYAQAMAEMSKTLANPPSMLGAELQIQLLQLVLQGVRDQAQQALE